MTQFSGLEPGQMAYVGYSSDSESDEQVSQCVPFNPFSFAMQYDTFVWAILLNNVDDYLQALRPRRVYTGDTAIVLETIEGLAAYPQEVMQGAQYQSAGPVCQTILIQTEWEIKHYEGFDVNGKPIYKYSTWGWRDKREGASMEGVLYFSFNVPCEYIEWDTGYIEEIIPASSGFSKRFPYSISVPSEETYGEGSQGHIFSPAQCRTARKSLISAGRF